jgi:hypothetical protein
MLMKSSPSYPSVSGQANCGALVSGDLTLPGITAPTCPHLAARHIHADHRNRIEYLRPGALLVFGAPDQLQSLAGQEHGQTIPLAKSASDRKFSAPLHVCKRISGQFHPLGLLHCT